MTTPLHLGGFVTMTLPFVRDGATNLGGFFSQRETDQKTLADSTVYPSKISIRKKLTKSASMRQV